MKDGWVNVPFWFAWLVWSWLLVIPVMFCIVLVEWFFHFDLGSAWNFDIGIAGSWILGLLATLVSR